MEFCEEVFEVACRALSNYQSQYLLVFYQVLDEGELSDVPINEWEFKQLEYISKDDLDTEQLKQLHPPKIEHSIGLKIIFLDHMSPQESNRPQTHDNRNE